MEQIEVSFRTHITYLIAHKYGPLGHLDSNIFQNSCFHTDFLKNLDKYIDRNKESELFVKHYAEEYGGQFPIWVAIELVPFSGLSKLYRNLLIEDQKEIASKYYNISYFNLQSWLHTVSHLRNVCAHYGRLYNKRLVVKPILKNNGQIMSSDSLLAGIYIIARLVSKSAALNLRIELLSLFYAYEQSIDLKKSVLQTIGRQLFGKLIPIK